MSIKTAEAKEGVDVRTINYDALIKGPYIEPVKEGGANYYKCAD